VLTLLGFAMIVAFMALIMTKRMSALTALILVPIVFALLAGFRGEIGPMMLEGITALAPTAVMLLFAILFFSIMMDVGLFDPLIRLIVWAVREDPLKIVVGTAVLALLVSLDGDGTTTYLIVIAALLPLYKRLGLSRLVLASVIMQAGGVMNILPWGSDGSRGECPQDRSVGDLRPHDSRDGRCGRVGDHPRIHPRCSRTSATQGTRRRLAR
jgi:CitMHS family citrate-Mg2+:H+ or citrate-Ca2+:H+ symporter